MAPISSSANNNTNDSLSLSPTTTSLQDMSAAAAAIALDMKPTKVVDLAQTQQKIKKLVRRNASDKLKLIQMVHDNPILWDSRLPNFKGAEEEKNRAWEHIGKEFNAPGRRVARAFKSLRESYRRELAHVKIMGNGFKPKWSLYEAMDFLRDVIRERKGGSHATDALALGLNLSGFVAHHMNNNNSINNNNATSKSNLKMANVALHTSSPFSEAALNLSKCSSVSQEDYYYFVKPELDLSTGSAAAVAAAAAAVAGGANQQPLPAHQTQLQHLNNSSNNIHNSEQQQQQQQQLHNDSRVTSTRNDNGAGTACSIGGHHNNSTYDDMDASSLRSGDDDEQGSVRNTHDDCSDEVEELEAIDADFPYPLILDSNSPTSASNERGDGGSSIGGGVGRKRRRRQLDAEMDCDGGSLNDVGGGGGVGGAAGTDDDYEDQMLQQHRHLRQQHSAVADIPPPQTVREVLNSKFCGFISAKLNSMEDSEADNLMNRILMLLVQTQANEAK